jgi:hypothetical protein
MAIGDPVETPDERTLLKKTLEFALNVMETPAVGPRASGYAAFGEWAKAIANDSEFSGGTLLPVLFTRLMCQTDAFTMVSEGRAYAGWFLKEEAGRFPDMADELMVISGIFKKEHETMFEMLPFHGGLQMGEHQAMELAKRENRIKIAELIRKAEALDRRAGQLIHQFLDRMSAGGK